MVKYDYELKRSARRSIGISIKDDNSIIVRAPLRMPQKDIDKFILSKSKWIDGHLNKNAAKAVALSEIIEYKKILVSGVSLPLFIGGKNLFSPEFVQVKSFKELKKLYVDNLGGAFFKVFNQILNDFNFSCGKVEFKSYKSKWGCCDRAGNIVFNYKLLMLPENLWRYVAVHELCHTVYMNHSKNFYALVGSILPDFKSDVKKLKSYSRITSLY